MTKSRLRREFDIFVITSVGILLAILAVAAGMFTVALPFAEERIGWMCIVTVPITVAAARATYVIKKWVDKNWELR